MSAARWLFLFLTVFIAGRVCAADKAEPAISFAALPATDRLVIFFESAGCFSYSAAEFVYNPAGNGSFEVTDMIPDRVVGGERQFRRSFLGTAQLEAGEKQKLDAMLHRYRNPEPVTLVLIGPAVPRFSIQQRRGLKLVTREELSSPLPENQDPALLTFSEMYGALLRARREQPGT